MDRLLSANGASRHLYSVDLEKPGLAPEMTLAYLKQHFGERAEEVKTFMRVWSVIERSQPGGPLHCVAAAGLKQAYDIPLFHSDDDKATVMMVQRMIHLLSETMKPGAPVMVYVDPAQETKWERLLTSLHARPANRWLVPMGVPAEEL